MGVSVQTLQPDDWPILRDVRLRALANEHYPADYDTESRFTEKQWRRRASSDMGQSFILCDRDPADVIGLGSIFLKHPGVGLMCHTYIDPAYRGWNHVAKLDVARVEWGVSQGLTHIQALPSARNTKSHHRLEEWGFMARGVFTHHVNERHTEDLALYIAAISDIVPHLDDLKHSAYALSR